MLVVNNYCSISFHLPLYLSTLLTAVLPCSSHIHSPTSPADVSTCESCFPKLSAFPGDHRHKVQEFAQLGKTVLSPNPCSLAWLVNYKRSAPKPPVSPNTLKSRLSFNSGWQDTCFWNSSPPPPHLLGFTTQKQTFTLVKIYQKEVWPGMFPLKFCLKRRRGPFKNIYKIRDLKAFSGVSGKHSA